MTVVAPVEGNPWKIKSTALIIKRQSDGTFRLLVFSVKDVKGLYFPGGNLDAGESYEQALYRELWEESGITSDDVTLMRKLGVMRFYNPVKENNVERHCYLLAIRPDYADHWEYLVRGDGNDAGDTFHYEFITPEQVSYINVAYAQFVTPEHMPEFFNDSNRFVTIVDYDASWKAQFEQAKNALELLIGEQVEAIEHIGSTSIEGIAAKPVIDIMIGVQSLSEADAQIVPVLSNAGYEYVPEFEDTMPERRYFRRYNDTGEVDLHIHLWQSDNSENQRHLLFRDYLRSHIEDREAYAKLKRTLAERLPRSAYPDAKSGFVRAIEARARAELGKG